MTRTGLDVDFCRAQFPAFTDPDTAGWAHLENAGGSYVPRQVIDKLHHFFTATKVQPYWDWGPSAAAGEAMDRSYEKIAATLAADPDEVHFGPSTTQNTYVLAHALREEMEAGDEVIVTNQDHEANIGSWRRLAATGVVVREWGVDTDTGLLDTDALEPLVNDRTRLVCVTHCSNVAATVNPIRAIADLAHSVGARTVVDGVSFAPHGAVDADALGCDFYLYSAYKTFGPHIGVLFTRAEHLEHVANQGHFFNADKPHTKLIPAGPDHAEIAAASGIVDYFDEVHDHHFGPTSRDGVERIRATFELFAAHEEALVQPLIALLTGRDGVRLLGAPVADHDVRAPTVAFASNRSSSAEIYRALVAGGVACGHGHFYARRLIEAVGLDPDDGAVRLSLVHYNTREEIDRALDVLDGLL